MGRRLTLVMSDGSFKVRVNLCLWKLPSRGLETLQIIAITDDAAHHRQAVYKLCWQQILKSGTSKINMIVGRHSLRDSKTNQVYRSAFYF